MIEYLLENHCGTFEGAQKYFEPESSAIIDVMDQLFTRFQTESGFFEYTWLALRTQQTKIIARIYAILLGNQYGRGVDISGFFG